MLTRHPGPPLWLAVKDAIATMPRNDARASFHADRTRCAFSAGSHRADCRVDLRLVRDNLGHVSPPTTSQYLHADDDWRHSETDAKHRPGS
ncbi:integrase [Burkholderia sp. 567]